MAADRMKRRRKQIRAGQRAFREREEATKNALQQRAHHLERIVKDMSAALLDLGQSEAFATTLPPSLITDYDNVRGEFERLARDRIHKPSESKDLGSSLLETDHSVGGNTRVLVRKGNEEKNAVTPGLSESSQLETINGNQSARRTDGLLNTSLGTNETRDTMLGSGEVALQSWGDDSPSYPNGSEIHGIYQPLAEFWRSNSNAFLLEQPQQDSYWSRDLQSNEVANPHTPPYFRHQIPRLGNELPLPSSYSHYETSFARRLIRATTEDSYRLLMNPGSNPKDLQRLCTFAFCFMKVPKLLQLYRETMERTARQDLEHWSTAAYHVGGSGLHYPRIGIDSSSEPPPWWAAPGPMGPRLQTDPETPIPKGIVDFLELSGVKGEWFDANDVVEYLRSKGLGLDMDSSMVELTTSSDSILQPSLGEIPSLYQADLQGQLPNSIPYNFDWGPTTDRIQNTLSSDQAFVQSLGLPAFPDQVPNFTLMSKRYLNVENFVRGT